MVFLKSTVSAVRICNTSIVQYLKKYIEYIRMCLFHLIEQNYRVRFTTDSFGQLTTLIVANISRRLLRSGEIQNVSPCTHSYRYGPYSVRHRTACSARSFASSVLPTPVGPRNRKEPIGLVGSLIPALERRMASVTSVSTLHPGRHTFVQSSPDARSLVLSRSRNLWLPECLSSER